MHCPTLNELQPSPGKTGWPWTKESTRWPETRPDGSSWPKVSVVTPSYNQGEFLEETIRSVLLQGYPNLEYIVVDGGSTDDSVEIIRKYERWLSRWVSEPDQGQADAINKGWRMASGEILAWLNSDDVYMPEAVNTSVEAFLEHPEAGLVYGDALFINETGKSLAVRKSGRGGRRRLLWFKQHMSQPASFMRASAVNKAGYLDLDLYANLDYEFFIRMSKVAPMVYLPRVQAKMRMYMEIKSLVNLDRNWKERVSVLRQYNKLWFLSPLWFWYLCYRVWRHFPPSWKNRIRSLRGLPRDRIFLDAGTSREA